MRTAALLAAITVAMTESTLAAGKSVLFVGTSFLFGPGSAVRFYRADGGFSARQAFQGWSCS